jgi:hypothetical protein
MTFDEFVDEYNGAPIDLEEFANIIVSLEDIENGDHSRLLNAAECYIAAKSVLEDELQVNGITIG